MQSSNYCSVEETNSQKEKLKQTETNSPIDVGQGRELAAFHRGNAHRAEIPNSTAFDWPFQLSSRLAFGPEYGMSSGELPDLLLLPSSSLERGRCIARYALLAGVDQHQQRGKSTKIHTRKLSKTPDAIPKVQTNKQVGGWTYGSGGLALAGRPPLRGIAAAQAQRLPREGQRRTDWR